MEGKRIYCIRRSFVSESDNVIENLSLDGMSGSSKAMNLSTGRCLLRFKNDLLKMKELLTTPTYLQWRDVLRVDDYRRKQTKKAEPFDPAFSLLKLYVGFTS